MGAQTRLYFTHFVRRAYIKKTKIRHAKEIVLHSLGKIFKFIQNATIKIYISPRELGSSKRQKKWIKSSTIRNVWRQNTRITAKLSLRLN